MISKIAKHEIVAVVLLLLFPVIADAKIEYTLFPRVAVEGRYSDNYYNREKKEDKKEAFVITVSPGILLSLITKDATLDLDYSLNTTEYFIERGNEEGGGYEERSEYFNQKGSGALRVSLLRDFSILLRDEIIKDEDVSLIDEALTRRERRVKYIRNISGGELIYRYGEEREAAAGYTFTILDYFENIIDDNKRHDFTGRIRHSFDIKNLGEVNYRHSITDYRRLNDPGQVSRDDSYEDEVKGRFTHRFTKRLSSGLSYGYLETHYNGLTSDSHVHDAAIESTYEITAYLKADGRIGGFLRELYGRGRDAGDAWDKGLIYRAGITYANPILTGAVAYDGGYNSNDVNPERFEFYEYWGIRGEMTYAIIRDILMLTGRGAYRVYEYPDSLDNRKDHIWNAGGGISYKIWDWLLFSLDYNHGVRNSNIPGLDFAENTYLARFIISYKYSTIERKDILE